MSEQPEAMTLKSPLRRPWPIAVVWPNVAVALVFLILLLLRQFAGLHDFLAALAFALVNANLVSLVAWFFVSTVARRRAGKPLPLGPTLAASVLLLVPLGCLAVQALLTWVGLLPEHDFWGQYFSTLRVCLPLAVVFGLGAFAHASMQQRLTAAEHRLREQELAQERSRGLAMEARLQALVARLQPHFLFNTLNAISALIASDPGRAEQMLGRLAAMLRTSLDSNERRTIPLREELTFVEHYLEIERSRFGSRLRVSFDVPAALGEYQVPPMAVQSLVENAVKHGVAPIPGGGDICVATHAGDDGRLHIQVSDSGGGFSLADVPSGHGLENLVERLHALFAEAAGIDTWRQEGRCVVELRIPKT